MTDTHVIDGSAEEIPADTAADEVASPVDRSEHEPSRELAHRPQHGGSTELIVAANAEERVAIATDVATQLDKVIRAQGMRTKMGSRKKIDPNTGEPARNPESGAEIWEPRWHVNVEGWQTLATLLGLAVVPLEATPVCDPITRQPLKVSFEVKERVTKGQGDRRTVTERTYTVEGYSWKCRVEVFKDGGLIAAGESVCSRTEQRWKEADDYAVMGMAQTRATSRAIAAAARWIITLAGYNATPSEEMPLDAASDGPPPQPVAAAIAALPDEHLPKLAVALATLLDTDNPYATQEIIDTLKGPDIGAGAVPLMVARALMKIAAVRARPQNAPASADGETPSQSPEGPTHETPAGETLPDDAEIARQAAKAAEMAGQPQGPINAVADATRRREQAAAAAKGDPS